MLPFFVRVLPPSLIRACRSCDDRFDRFAQTPGRDGERRAAALRQFGSRNTASSGELLAGFFRYFAYELDCRANVVSTPTVPRQFPFLLVLLAVISSPVDNIVGFHPHVHTIPGHLPAVLLVSHFLALSSSLRLAGPWIPLVSIPQVSVRLGGLAVRERKAEGCCWSMHTRLSLEDPFETW